MEIQWNWYSFIHSFIHFIFNTISTTIRPETLLSSPVILKVLSEDHGFLETLNRVYEVKIIFIIKSIHCLSFQFVDFVLIVQKQPLAWTNQGNDTNQCWAATVVITFTHSLKKKKALAGMAQWIDRWPGNKRVLGLIPSQGTCLGCRWGP